MALLMKEKFLENAYMATLSSNGGRKNDRRLCVSVVLPCVVFTVPCLSSSRS